jgi:hypothetical protein
MNNIKSSKSERSLAKQTKHDQLHALLVNKFRNKHNVGSSAEDLKIDRLIYDEVSALLANGSAYEANLYALDKKLDALICEIRGVNPQASKVKR